MKKLSYFATAVVLTGTLCLLKMEAATPEANATGGSSASKTAFLEKKISLESLAKYKTISVGADHHGKKAQYSGVPLRALLGEQVPAIDTMANWRKLAQEELVVEVRGDDGFPALITATELATNESGDRFLLATKCDDKPMAEGIQLVCPNDQQHVRWVRHVASFRIIPVAGQH